MYAKRKTINANVSISGIGLHSGIYTRINLQPAVAGSGITFVRDDLDGLRIAALQASTTALDHATTVGKDDVSVGTVEHLLSAVMAAGITDLDVHIDGPEVPIIDGSALPFLHLIDAAGVRELGMEVPVLRIREAIAPGTPCPRASWPRSSLKSRSTKRGSIQRAPARQYSPEAALVW